MAEPHETDVSFQSVLNNHEKRPGFLEELQLPMRDTLAKEQASLSLALMDLRQSVTKASRK